MTIRNWITEEIMLRGNDILLNMSIGKNLRFLLGSQRMSDLELENYQNIRLEKLIHHSYNNVSFYKEMFDKLNLKPEDIKNKEDLQKLPILTNNS